MYFYAVFWMRKPWKVENKVKLGYGVNDVCSGLDGC